MYISQLAIKREQYETYNNINEAIDREKQLKKYNRDWKVRLIEENNPEWEDLYNSL